MTDQPHFHAKCRADEADRIEVRAGVDWIAVEIDRPINENFALVELDIADARALFNWIGIWLHTR